MPEPTLEDRRVAISINHHISTVVDVHRFVSGRVGIEIGYPAHIRLGGDFDQLRGLLVEALRQLDALGGGDGR